MYEEGSLQISMMYDVLKVLNGLPSIHTVDYFYYYYYVLLFSLHQDILAHHDVGIAAAIYISW